MVAEGVRPAIVLESKVEDKVSFVTDEYTVSDNFFDMMPNETKTVNIHFDNEVVDFIPKIKNTHHVLNIRKSFISWMNVRKMG